MDEKTYPRHVHARGGVYRVCEDAASYYQALKDGWVDHPPLAWGTPDRYQEWDGVPLNGYVAQAETVVIPEVKKRGRPRKTESP